MGLDFWKPLLERRSPVAGLAQLVEQLICNHQVRGSTPLAGTISPPCGASSSATARQRPVPAVSQLSLSALFFGGSDWQVSAKFSADLSSATDRAKICGDLPLHRRHQGYREKHCRGQTEQASYIVKAPPEHKLGPYVGACLFWMNGLKSFVRRHDCYDGKRPVTKKCDASSDPQPLGR